MNGREKAALDAGITDGGSGESYSPEKEERRESGLNPDVMDEEDERWFNPKKKEGSPD